MSDEKVILAIDNEQVILNLLQSVLSASGYKPYSSTSPTRGIQLATSINPVLICLDRDMPEMDGHDVLRILKSQPNTRDIPVMMLTGTKEETAIRESIKLGAAGYVIKPFTPSDLLKQINRILGEDKNKVYLG